MRSFTKDASSLSSCKQRPFGPQYPISNSRKTQIFIRRKNVKKLQMAVMCALGYKQAAASLTGRLTPPRHPRRFAPRAPTKRTHKQTDCPDLRSFHPVIRWHDTANRQRGGTGVCAEPLANRPSSRAVHSCPCCIGRLFRPHGLSFCGILSAEEAERPVTSGHKSSHEARFG